MKKQRLVWLRNDTPPHSRNIKIQLHSPVQAAAFEALRDHGYAVLRLGAVSPLRELERIAREL